MSNEHLEWEYMESARHDPEFECCTCSCRKEKKRLNERSIKKAIELLEEEEVKCESPKK